MSFGTQMSNSIDTRHRPILSTLGSPEWEPWVLDEEDSIQQIKFAYDAGVQTFDTANIYSNGLSEVVLGKAIKQHCFPRSEIVVMTKVSLALESS